MSSLIAESRSVVAENFLSNDLVSNTLKIPRKFQGAAAFHYITFGQKI